MDYLMDDATDADHGKAAILDLSDLRSHAVTLPNPRTS
jgi:hypothetical protein